MSALALAAALAFAAPAESVADFAQAVELATAADAPFHRLDLPATVYATAQRADLGDLRVFNAAGEAVAHALHRPPAADAPAPDMFKPPLFRLPVARGETGTGAVRIERRPDGTIVSVIAADARAAGAGTGAWLLDLSAHEGAIHALEADPVPQALPWAGQLRVEASDDLRAWRTIAADAPLLHLQSGEVTLSKQRVEFTPLRARYLRLSWSGDAPPKGLTGVRVEPAPALPETRRVWLALPGRAAGEGEFAYDIGPATAPDRLRVALPQANSVLQVHFSARAKAADAWREVARTMLYRLQSGEREWTNPDVPVALAGARQLQMKVASRGTGTLRDAPYLEAGLQPHELVFAARGAGPYRLAWGSGRVQPAALPIAALVPGWNDGPDKHPPIAAAQLGAAVTAGGDKALAAPIDWKRIALWMSLGAAVAGLSWMALRLLRQLRSRPAEEMDFD